MIDSAVAFAEHRTACFVIFLKSTSGLMKAIIAAPYLISLHFLKSFI